MWQDEIIEEIRKIRDEHARQFNYDLKAIYLALKEEEKKSPLNFVNHSRMKNHFRKLEEQ